MCTLKEIKPLEQNWLAYEGLTKEVISIPGLKQRSQVLVFVFFWGLEGRRKQSGKDYVKIRKDHGNNA